MEKAACSQGLEVMDTVFAEGMDHFPKMVPEIIEKAKQQAVITAKAMAKEVAPVS